jgi:hypothetical protein
LGRFLSPDNYIQDPFNTQSYNRYGYVLNNPLKYVDPSGEFWWIVGAIIGGYLGGAAANGTLNPFKWTWDSNTWGAVIGGAIIGALGGAAYSFGELSGVLLSAGIGQGAAIPIVAFEIGAGVTSLAIAGFGVAAWSNNKDKRSERNETFTDAFSEGGPSGYEEESSVENGAYVEGSHDDWAMEVDYGKEYQPKTGHAYGIGFDGAAGGGIGFEIGLINDYTGNWGLYLKANGVAGYGGGVSIIGSEIKPVTGGFLIKNYKGRGASYNVGFSTPIGGYSIIYGGSLGDGVGGRKAMLLNSFGQNKGGYTEGSLSLMPKSFGLFRFGATYSRGKTYLWDF